MHLLNTNTNTGYLKSEDQDQPRRKHKNNSGRCGSISGVKCAEGRGNPTYTSGAYYH